MRKKIILCTAIVSLSFFVLAQQITHESVVVNIEVQTRVFRGNTFIDNLTKDDFLIYEDGKLQDVDAVYLIKSTEIQREDTDMNPEEAQQTFAPDVSRNIVLNFDMKDYLPKIDEALDLFIENFLSPEDTLIVMTPVKTYNFKKEALSLVPREKIAERLKEIVRKDIQLGGVEYKGLIRDYMNLYRSDMEMDLKLYMMQEKIREIQNSRYLPEKKMEEFSEYLRNMAGQKFVFYFYQNEKLPLPPFAVEDPKYFEFIGEIMSSAAFDPEAIKQTFSDSSISLHFLYVTQNRYSLGDVENSGKSDMSMQDISSNMFGILGEIANATGGVTETSANVASMFEKAEDATENYYLLYYTPKEYTMDGKFKTIEVKVKDKNYRITHRQGYFAN
ncbi:MAG: hypothetical protein MUP98_10885 [Candidatus Aminicenantes bacterium]|nr:hypothetical protein [Candidatus Aminicenantes bacterium]